MGRRPSAAGQTSAWKPNQKIEYTRTVFVPNYPVHRTVANPDRALHAVDRRAPDACRATRSRGASIWSGQLQILPQSENIFLIYKEGWHPAEVSSQDPTMEWQWTRKAATISFRNPKKDSTFYLEYDARTDQFNPPSRSP